MSQTWNPFGGSTGSSFEIRLAPLRCPTCSDPSLIPMKRATLLQLLEDARKLTHPDLNASPAATKVTAALNACIDEVKRAPR